MSKKDDDGNDLQIDFQLVSSKDQDNESQEDLNETIDEKEEFRTRLNEELRWLSLICPEPPPLEDMEKTAQAFGVLKAVNPFMRKFDKKDIIKIGLIGHIAQKARLADEKKFMEISPHAYFHLAHYFVSPEDEGEEYKSFVKKLIS